MADDILSAVRKTAFVLDHDKDKGKQPQAATIRLGLLRLFHMDLLDNIESIYSNNSFRDDCIIVTLERKRDGEFFAFKVPNRVFTDRNPVDFPLDEATKAKVILFLA